MDHLVCFLPGTVLLSITKGKTLASFRKLNVLEQEDLLYATKLMETCIAMYSTTATKLASEIVMFKTSKETEDQQDMWIKSGDTHNLLRPETVESLFYFWRITREEKYRDTAFMIFQAFEKYSRREAGYTNLIDVTNVDGDAKDKMESFWLGETLKYFYLIFSDKEEYPLNEYVFNTEAHAFPINH